jgi:hypothetical protein
VIKRLVPELIVFFTFARHIANMHQHATRHPALVGFMTVMFCVLAFCLLNEWVWEPIQKRRKAAMAATS